MENNKNINHKLVISNQKLKLDGAKLSKEIIDLNRQFSTEREELIHLKNFIKSIYRQHYDFLKEMSGNSNSVINKVLELNNVTTERGRTTRNKSKVPSIDFEEEEDTLLKEGYENYGSQESTRNASEENINDSRDTIFESSETSEVENAIMLPIEVKESGNVSTRRNTKTFSQKRKSFSYKNFCENYNKMNRRESINENECKGGDNAKNLHKFSCSTPSQSNNNNKEILLFCKPVCVRLKRLTPKDIQHVTGHSKNSSKSNISEHRMKEKSLDNGNVTKMKKSFEEDMGNVTLMKESLSLCKPISVCVKRLTSEDIQNMSGHSVNSSKGSNKNCETTEKSLISENVTEVNNTSDYVMREKHLEKDEMNIFNRLDASKNLEKFNNISFRNPKRKVLDSSQNFSDISLD